jgi:ABC-type sugar transport system ATPase subunit
MARIRIVEVTKSYQGPAPWRGWRIRASNVDRTFAEGVAAQEDGGQGDVAPLKDSPHNFVLALDHVNLEIPDGLTFAVVGPSGCGKTTLLRVVAGLEREYSGNIYYDDTEVDKIPVKERYIGMVFQNYALYPHFKGDENLGFFFRMHKIDDEETRERIRITSEIMGIGFNELLKRKPGTMSSGQQQKVAIARALVRNPRVLLFDEPLSRLDAKYRAQCRIEIRRLLNRFRITTLYVTHDQTEAILLADQIAVMRAGRIEQVGPYPELLQKPANTFVASFLGVPPMNILEGGAVTQGKLQLGDARVPLPDTIRWRVQEGQAVSVGIRPEVTFLTVDPSAPSKGIRLKGVVDIVEPDYARRIQSIHVRTGQQTYIATSPLDIPVCMNDPIEAVFPEDQLSFFDTQSGGRIEG